MAVLLIAPLPIPTQIPSLAHTRNFYHPGYQAEQYILQIPIPADIVQEIFHVDSLFGYCSYEPSE